MLAFSREAIGRLMSQPMTDGSEIASIKRDMPLVPATSIAGRALVTVIAIMTFLAGLTAGAALLIANASQSWQQSVATELTIQIRPIPGRDIEGDIKKASTIVTATKGVTAVRVFSHAESERLLEPWLGSGLDLSELPVPRLLLITIAPSSDRNWTSLKQELIEKVPSASLDDHHVWLKRLATMSQTIVSIAMAIFILVLTAMSLAVVFATRGAMAGNKEIIEVLHFVGAEDSYISSQFQKHFLRLGLTGGLIGGCAAMVIFFIAGVFARSMTATPTGDQVEALFGGFAMSWIGYLIILIISIAIAFLTGFISRSIVFRHLQRLN